MNHGGGEKSGASGASRVLWGISWVGGAILLLVLSTQFDGQEISRRSLAWIEGLGALGPVAYIFLYVIASLLFVPGSVLTLGGGALFGVAAGSAYVSLAATLAATSAFLIGRYLARDWLARKMERYPRFRAIDEAVAREGWKIVGLVRLSPVFPFGLVNYAFGLTRVSLNHYVFASWLGMLPGTVLYVFLGSLGGDLAAGRSRSAFEWSVYAAGLLATVLVTAFVTRIARRSLAQQVA